MYTLYMHFNRLNGKKYIGITCRKLNYRFGKDGSGYKKCPVFWNAIQKYGWDNFEHRILKTDLTEEEAKDLEKKYIAAFQTNDRRFGYNLLEGGQGGPMPQEVKDKISEFLKGKPNGREGTHHAEESKEKISAALRGRKLSEETKKKISAAVCERMAKRVLCVDTGVVYESATACAKELGVLISSLSNSIKQGWKCKGFHFEYYDIDEGD